jgi:3-deoxy-D-manno-octulosonic-acid transferase
VAEWRRRHPDWAVVVSTFTPTGQEVAKKTFSDLPVFFWPLDFAPCVSRALRRVRPSLVALVELEVWPGFMAAAARRGIPVAVINGRISDRSAPRYRKAGFMRAAFRRVALFCAQERRYAQRAEGLGFPRVLTSGNMKFDGLAGPPSDSARAALAAKLGLEPGARVLVGGSTHDPEERFLVHAFEELRNDFADLRLVLVPRHPERAGEVARAVSEAGFDAARKSSIDAGEAPAPDAIVVVDTVGELRTLWGLATVAYVGGSLTPRGGQNIMEPAAMGRPVVFGPNMANFREARDLLCGAEGCVQVEDDRALLPALRRLLADPASAAAMGDRARKALEAQAGATARHIEAVEALALGPAGAQNGPPR